MGLLGGRLPRLTKRGWIVTGVVLALLIGGGSWFAVSQLGDDETLEPVVEGTGGFVDPPQEEEWGDVHFTFTIEVEGGEHQNVYFVEEGASEGELLTAAVECVDELLPDYFGVSCYAFDSEEALEFSEPDPETGAMANLCWRAFHSDSEKADEGSGSKAGAQYEEEGCPEA